MPVAMTPERAKRIEALAAHPLLERRIAAQDLRGGHVVDAGVAENVRRRVGLAHVGHALADDNAEFTFEHHLAVEMARFADHRAVRAKGIVALEKIQWVGGQGNVFLGRAFMEIVPQRRHLGWNARREQSYLAQVERRAGVAVRAKHVAGIDMDDVTRDGSEPDAALVGVAQPAGHQATLSGIFKS